jgi:hypothetical protein
VSRNTQEGNGSAWEETRGIGERERQVGKKRWQAVLQAGRQPLVRLENRLQGRHTQEAGTQVEAGWQKQGCRLEGGEDMQ